MNQQTLQAQVHEEVAKFKKIMDELLILRATSLELKKFRKMMPYRKYD